jgi:hypothetical protein
MRYHLRTLLILLAMGPPVIAYVLTRNEQALFAAGFVVLLQCAVAMWKTRR